MWHPAASSTLIYTDITTWIMFCVWNALLVQKEGRLVKDKQRPYTHTKYNIFANKKSRNFEEVMKPNNAGLIAINVVIGKGKNKMRKSQIGLHCMYVFFFH